MADKPQITSRQFKNRKSYENDVAKMMAQGWTVQSVTTTESRRMSGCIFGVIGYWLFPKRTVFHVTYAKGLPTPPNPPTLP